MTPLEVGASLLQVSLFLVPGWIVGSLALRALGDVTRRETDGHISFVEHRFGAPERALMAIAGSVAWSVALMLVHVLSGGRVFDNPVAVPLLTAALIILFFLQNRVAIQRVSGVRIALFRIARERRVLIGTVALAIVLVALYVVPMIASGSSVRSGDSPWHLGWTEQLLAGERVPTGPAPEFGRNAYPWGFHAVIATCVRLVPGTSPLQALESLHLLLVAAIPLAGAVLGRRIAAAAGWPAAVATSLIGGFGWIWARAPEFSTSPRGAKFGADLVVASPNSVYELFPPALPRELGLILLAAAAFLMLAPARNARVATMLTGASVGLVGLVSVPMFVSALVWLAAISLIAGPGARLRSAGTMLVPALVVFGLWALPVAIDYVRFGGFVNITPALGREWPLPVALGSWGLLLPLALGGAYFAVHSLRPRARPVLALAGGTLVLLTLALARGLFDWGLAGNATLLHQGRIWPPAHLLAGAFAGVGLLRIYRWIEPRSRAVALGALGFLLTLGAVSPVLASMELTEEMRAGRAGFVYDSPEIVDETSFVQEAASRLSPDDVVLVEGPEAADELAFLLFQFSGVRLADYDHPNLGSNDLRIRFRDLAQRWHQRVDGAGFRPDFLVTPGPGPGPGAAVAAGTFAGQDWVMVPAETGL